MAEKIGQCRGAAPERRWDGAGAAGKGAGGLRRPIIYIMGGFASGIAGASRFGAVALIAAAALLSIMAAVVFGLRMYGEESRAAGSMLALCWITGRKAPCELRGAAGWMAVLLVFAIAGSGWYLLRDGAKTPLAACTDKTVCLSGTVLSVQPAADPKKKDKLVLAVKSAVFSKEDYAETFEETAVPSGESGGSYIAQPLSGEHSGSYVVKPTSGEKVLVSLKGKQENLHDLTGRKIEISGFFGKSMVATNPNMFDYSRYLKSRGIRFTMTSETEDIRILQGVANPVTNYISNFKQRFRLMINGTMDQDSAAILFGMIFGDKTFLDPDIYGDFQKNGTAHILSVSGIHVGILYACMEALAGRGRRRSVAYNSVSAAVLIMYMFIAEFSPSVVRACFMILVFIASKMLNERYDFTASTAFTAFVLLLYNPFYLLNTGFILSYMAVFVLAVILKTAVGITERLTDNDKYGLGISKKTPLQKVMTLIVPAVVIQIGMAPLTAYFFNFFSFSAFIINIPVIFLAGLLLPAGFILMGLSYVSDFFPVLFEFTSFIADYPIRFMIRLNHLAAVPGKGFIPVPSPSLKWIFLYYGSLFFFASETGQRISISRKKRPIAAGALVLLVVLALVGLRGYYERADIVFIDVGQGDGIHIKTPSGRNILIDGGGSINEEVDVGKDILYPYFMKNGVSEIDLAIITHMHEDHYGGAASLNTLMPVKKFALFEGYAAKESEVKEKLNIRKQDNYGKQSGRKHSKQNDQGILYLKAGQTIQLDKNVMAEILYPKWDGEESNLQTEDENKNMLVIRITYDGVSILDTGDLEETGELELVNMYAMPLMPGEQDQENVSGQNDALKSMILSVGHHGSKNSSSQEFLRAADPDVAIIQVGRHNRYGHPATQALQRFSESEIPVYRNDEHGAILVDIGVKNIKIMNMQDKKWKKIEKN